MRKTLGQRMKEYEYVTDIKLIKNMPVIIRLDGRAFHTFTKGLKKPFDNVFNDCMVFTMKYLCENINNCVFGYTQSDEITLVLFAKDDNSETWFGNRLQKVVSISSSMATLAFNKKFLECCNDQKQDILSQKLFMAMFDARAFNIPIEDVVNNIIWRQNDATKNSINSVAQANFSFKELQGKKCSEMQDMLMLQKEINWNNTPTMFKRGCCCIRKEVEVVTPNGKTNRNKWIIDYEMPILSQNKEYLERLLKEGK